MRPGARGRIVNAIPAFRRQRKVRALDRAMQARRGTGVFHGPPRAWLRAFRVASRDTSHMRVSPTRRQRKAGARMARLVARYGLAG